MALVELFPDQPDGSHEPENLIAPLSPFETQKDFFLPNNMECTTLEQRIGGGVIHRYVKMEVDGFSHKGWYTPADREQDSDYLLVVKPGLAEVIHDGIGFTLHKRLATALPTMSVFSHETDGVGKYAESLSPSDLLTHGIDQMSLQGLELLKRFGEGKRIITLGTSMGTVIFNNLLLNNINQGEPVDVAGVVNFAPALVDPRRVPLDMAARFVPGLAVDLAKEIVKTDGRHIGNFILMLLDSRPSFKDILPFSKQIFDLLHGTPLEEIEEVVSRYPVDVIVGDRDPVGQYKMWLKLEEKYPELTAHILHKKGHGISIKPYESSKKISAVVSKRYQTSLSESETSRSV